MFNDKNLELFFCEFNYDIRLYSKYARWIDQKCTPDVVCIISDCILNFVNDNHQSFFTTKDVWNSYYAKEISVLFSKPDIRSSNSKNEYDKFFQQPMELLAYSGVLSKEKEGNKNIYTVKNIELLEYISIKERNTLKFLTCYIYHVLKDSNLISYFTNFFNNPNPDTFFYLKNKFEDNIIKNTAINTSIECRRIFTKVLNPLSFYSKSYGTDKGRISKQKISYDQLMYNRTNFRDIYTNKPKNITRYEYGLTYTEKLELERYWKYNSNKAKKFLRKFNDEYFNSYSEFNDSLANSKATHIHHIFPASSYPIISGYLENLIALTPSQHLNKAHPNGRTQEINKDYQYLLLISKIKKIEDNLIQNNIPKIYSFDKLREVLAIGLSNDNIYNIPDMQFQEINRLLRIYY